MIDTIKELSLLCGTSGRETTVREYIISKIDGKCEWHKDALGNIIAFKKGKNEAAHKVMLDAHTDEVGVIVTFITSDGMLKFSPVGGIDTKVLLARQIVFDNGTVGVVGIKPIHLSKGDEKTKIPDADSLYIDIGAASKEEAEKYIKPGDTGVFMSDFVEFGDNKIKGKALDDRVGCAVMLDMINSELPYDAYFSFSVQEEIGLRGAATSAFGIDPEYAIVLETTTAADLIDVPEHKKVCKLGEGAAVSFMDRSTLYNKELFDTAFRVAEEKDIKVQPKTVIAGGNNAGAIHKSRAGIKTLTINTPCRYLHSASCICDKNDIESVRKLAEAVLCEFAK
ncbi:MAG: M42 family metallopeptidase [Clostridia bacterium]|nr:M42 family metallopeptidase [Clostridia bacterium]